MATAPGSPRDQRQRIFQFRLIHFFELTFWMAFIAGLGHAFSWGLAAMIAAIAPIILLVNWLLSRATWKGSRWLLPVEVVFLAGAAWMTPVLYSVRRDLVDSWPAPFETAVDVVSILVALLGLVVSWAYFLGRRRYVGLLFFFVLSPFGFGAMHGAADYWRGSAVLPGNFRYRWVQANLDRTTRAPRRDWEGANAWGWPRGDEWIQDIPYELAVRGCTGVFGRMRGVHTGTYPTPPEAEAALRRATPVSHELLAHDVVVIGQEPIVVRAVELCQRYDGSIGYPEIDAALVGDCVVLGIKDTLDAGTSRYTAIALYDRVSGRPLAVYQLDPIRTVKIRLWAKWQGAWQPCSEIPKAGKHGT
ncbi:MAG: hypothetical protein L0211_20620 [Planctomycetaceae bacterium]|nr:hypothetical protein [Planctomycetaceae bacterium]